MFLNHTPWVLRKTQRGFQRIYEEGVGEGWVTRLYVTRTGYLICSVQCKIKMRDPLFKNYYGCHDTDSRALNQHRAPLNTKLRGTMQVTHPWRGPTCHDCLLKKLLGKLHEEWMDYNGQEEKLLRNILSVIQVSDGEGLNHVCESGSEVLSS